MITLRNYQSQSVDNTLEGFKNGIQSGIICCATGMGKSFLSINLALKFNALYGGKTLFLVDQIELAYQAKDSFLAIDPSLRVGIEMNSNTTHKHDDVVVACVATIGRKGSKRIGKFAPEEFTLVIADECDKSITPIWDRVFHYLGVHPENFEEGKLLVGLTATPSRRDGMSLGKYYDDFFANYDIVYGIKNGWLTDVKWLPVQSKTDISQVKVNGGEFSQLELANTIDNPVRNNEIVKAYVEQSAGEKAIVYCASVEHAYKIADLFIEHGINAHCIEANTEKKDRKKWVESFKNGSVDVITNYSTMTRGVDAPETTTLILARPIKTQGTYIQTIGRGLRPSATAFVDVFDTAEERKQGIARSVKPSCKIIDFCDVVGSHNVCTIPTLFGLNPKVKVKPTERFYEEVVEPVDLIRHEKNLDVSQIIDLDNLDLYIKKKRLNVVSFKPDEIIRQMSDLAWLKTGEDSYEISFSKDRACLIVEKNLVDKYDLLHLDLSTGLTRRMNTFTSLSGAIKTADDFARASFDVKFIQTSAPWRDKGVSHKQASKLKMIFKGGIFFGKERYEDTGVKHLYLRQRGGNVFIENSGHANDILNRIFNK